MTSANNATDYMTRPVVTIGQHDTLEAAIDLMIERSITCLTVLDRSGGLVGMLTEGDVLRRTASGSPAASARWLSFLSRGTMAPRRGDRKVCDVMTRSVISATSEATPESIIDLMRTNRIQHVPIVGRGRLVGLVCRTALLNALADAAVSAHTIAAERSVARQRWTRLNAMQMPTGGSVEVRVRDDVADLCGVIHQPTGLSQNQHPVA